MPATRLLHLRTTSKDCPCPLLFFGEYNAKGRREALLKLWAVLVTVVTRMGCTSVSSDGVGCIGDSGDKDGLYQCQQ